MPEIFCCFRWHNLEIGPPRGLVAIAMQVQMMISAQWYGEFVADLASERSRLGKFQVMRIAGRASADETRLRSDESKMSLVPASHFLADRRDHHCGRRLLFCDSSSVYRCGFVFCQSRFSQQPRGVSADPGDRRPVPPAGRDRRPLRRVHRLTSGYSSQQSDDAPIAPDRHRP